jgi:hypothetical protein
MSGWTGSLRAKPYSSIMSYVSSGYYGAVLVISGAISCFGYLLGIACGILGYQTAAKRFGSTVPRFFFLPHNMRCPCAG